MGEHQLVGEDDTVRTEDRGVAHLSAVTVELVPGKTHDYLKSTELVGEFVH